MRRLMVLILGGVAVMGTLGAGAQPGKTRRTLWSDEQIARLQAMAPEPGRYAELDDNALWELMPETTIPRSYSVDQTNRCPECGLLPDMRAWRRDYINHPLQLQCPLCSRWYPNNEYPDDGSGYVHSDGRIYQFLRFAAHWQYLDAVAPTPLAFARNYISTDDASWARRAALLLVRIAEQMPNDGDKADRTFKGGWSHWTGLITDYVWENIRLVWYAEAYDLIWDRIDGDAELVEFVSRRIPELDTGPKVREYIEDNLLRVGGQAIIEEVLDGNPGFPQMAGISIAAALDDYGEKRPNSADLIDWLYNGWGNFRFIFSNFLYPDGGGLESPAYSQIGIELLTTADRIEAYRLLAPQALPEDRYPNLFGDPRIRAMLDFHIGIHCQGMYFPSIGDSGNSFFGEYRRPTAAPVWGGTKFGGYDIAFRRSGDPRYARVLVDDEGELRWSDPIIGSPPEVLKQAAANVPSIIPRQPALFDGYGIAFLRSGAETSPRDVWLFYGAGRAHHHVDPLNLGIMAYQRRLLTDLGYPLQLAYPYRTWENNIWTHNTVIVDDGYPEPPGSWGITHTPHGIVELMSDLTDETTGLGVQVVRVSVPLRSVEVPEGALDIATYRRTVALVDVSPESFYVVDVFEAEGGSEHHLGYHFPHGDISIEGVDLQERPGTLAGEDIEYAGKTYAEGQFAGGYDPRSCMDQVRRGFATGTFSGEWRAPDDPQVGLRITHLPETGTEAVFARGRPPADPRKYQMQFMFARREGEAPMHSTFTSVLEAFADAAPAVTDARRYVVQDAIVIEVTSALGRDVLIFGAEQGVELPDDGISTDAAFAMVRIGGERASGSMVGGTHLQVGELSFAQPAATVEATIVSLDREAQTVTVDLPEGPSMVGQWVRIGNDARSGAYRVTEQSTDAGGRTVLTLDVTSLLSEGIVEGVEDYTVLNNVQIPLGGSQNGKIVHIDLHGAWLRAQGQAYRIANVEFGNFYTKRNNWDVYIDRDAHPDANAAALAANFTPGQVFGIYAYEIGDTVRFTPAVRVPVLEGHTR